MGKNLDQAIFDGLMDRLECETGNDIEVIGFRAKLNNHEISFHGNLEDGHDLTVEDFGTMRKRKWVQKEPTELQEIAMQGAVLDRLAHILHGPEAICYQENHGIYSSTY